MGRINVTSPIFAEPCAPTTASFPLGVNFRWFLGQRCWLQFRALHALNLSLACSGLLGQRLYLHRITSEVSPASLFQHYCYTFYP